MNTNSFQRRHIGPNNAEQAKMLATINAKNLEQLIDETVPDNILLRSPLDLEPAMSEYEYLGHIKELSEKNKVFKSYIGLGYNRSYLPAVIQRNILESPGWYTAYTPYQAEIAQGRLEALLNFQTMVCDLTGMELANASLLDESTAAAEAMTLLFAVRSRDQKKNNINKKNFFGLKDFFKNRNLGHDLRYPLPYHDESFLGIFSEHTLEHLHPFEAIRLLKEISNLLQDKHYSIQLELQQEN